MSSFYFVMVSCARIIQKKRNVKKNNICINCQISGIVIPNKEWFLITEEEQGKSIKSDTYEKATDCSKY